MEAIERKLDEILHLVKGKQPTKRELVFGEIAREAIDKKTPDFVLFIRDTVIEIITEFKDAPPPEIADKVALSICRNYGGGQLYLPQGIFATIEAQHWEIYERFTGANYFELAHEYGVSEVWVREIVKKCRRAFFEKAQNKLPGV